MLLSVVRLVSSQKVDAVHVDVALSVREMFCQSSEFFSLNFKETGEVTWDFLTLVMLHAN